MHYRSILCCAAALLAFSPTLTRAQGAPPQASGGSRDQARALADRGFALHEQGKYAEALAAFEEAERQFHAPTVLLMIARSQVKLGRLADARATYERIVDEQLANYAPPPFFEAQAAARKELEELAAQMPPEEKPAEPPKPAPLAPVVAPSPSEAPPPPKPASSSGLPVPALVAFGVAGLGLGVGAVTGAMTLGKVGELDTLCGAEKRCAPDPDTRTEYNDIRGSADTLATISTVSFVIAGVGAAAGLTLLLLRPGERNQEQVGLVISPAWIGVRGSL
ncbi:MAG TPA: tetratricopeptide repeat protein [Candidatus Nanopelagicales bacterium]|nr:tetratricopeptide repeat protein [Candidatus Nanopelagicales bacterium]